MRVTLFVPGNAAFAAGRHQALAGLASPPEVEWIDNDGHFGEAFSFGTVAPDVVAQIDAAPGALVLHWPIDLLTGRETIVATVARLRDAGALAVRLEQSKVGWAIESWLERFGADSPWAWYRGAVASLGSEGEVQSCGMHAFSLPDVLVRIDGDRDALVELAAVLSVYQLAEDPVIRSGETFRPDDSTPRRVVERWPDLRYPPDHACHNPFGVWRLGPPGGTARAMAKLHYTFVPPLVAILTALEQQHGAPLTRTQVEATRGKSACIAMDPRDAQTLERTRGYADLDPALAWEQWQLVRQRAR